MSHYYLDPSKENDKWSLPDLEVFWADKGDWNDEEGEPIKEGWYYWICFPGCIPDSEANGPFDSEEKALMDARDLYGCD